MSKKKTFASLLICFKTFFLKHIKNWDLKNYRKPNILRAIIEEIEKINIIERLDSKKIKEITKKELKALEIKNRWIRELRRSLTFLAIKSRFWERQNSIQEELKLRKITRKKTNEIERSETETKEMKKLK